MNEEEIRRQLSAKTLMAMAKRKFYIPRQELIQKFGLSGLLKIAKEERETWRKQQSLGR